MQEIGKVKKMMQNPVDESLIVFTGKYLLFARRNFSHSSISTAD